MRRPLAILAILLISAAPPAYRIVTPAGLVPNSTAAASVNRVAIQRAIDYLAAASLPASKVLLPEGDYYTDRPIFLDAPGVGLEGKGRGITQLISITGHDVLTVGIPRRPIATAEMSTDHFPDLSKTAGLKGVVSGPGQRYAFRTKGDHHLAQQGGALDDFPVGVTALTVDLAVDLTRLRDPGGSYTRDGQASLCGLGDGDTPSPWSLSVGNDRYYLRLAAADGSVQSVEFGKVPASPGFVRLTVQVDLSARTVGTWIDDKAVPNGASLPAGFVAFAANQHCPFGIGSTALNANVVADHFGGASDITFHGLRVTASALYKPGEALSRLDGKPVTDGRYFAPEPATQGLLWLVDDPALMASSRVATVLGKGNAGSTLYALDNAAHSSPWSATGPGPIRGLSLVSQQRYGRGIAVGYALGLDVRDCEVLGGRGGIASVNFGATYPLTVQDCSLGGSDSPLYLFMASAARVDRVEMPRQFRVGVRLVYSSVVIRSLFAAAWGESDAYVRSVGSSFVLEDSSFDNEGDGGPQVAPVYCVPGGEYGSLIRISRTGFAKYPGPLAVLDEIAAPDKLACRFVIADCPDVLRGDLGLGRIDVKGTRWRVSKDW